MASKARHKRPFRGRKGKSLRLLASIIAGGGITAFVAAVMWAFGVLPSAIISISIFVAIGAIALVHLVQATD